MPACWREPRISTEPTRSGARIIPHRFPPATADAPHSWREPDLMLALTGRPLERGYIEAVVPIFRVVHPCLDSEGRQVGEGNVFPKALRLDVPTQWRTCTYSGTRYQPHRPMNVAALKAMRTHWREMMPVLREIRAAISAAFRIPRTGGRSAMSSGFRPWSSLCRPGC